MPLFDPLLAGQNYSVVEGTYSADMLGPSGDTAVYLGNGGLDTFIGTADAFEIFYINGDYQSGTSITSPLNTFTYVTDILSIDVRENASVTLTDTNITADAYTVYFDFIRWVEIVGDDLTVNITTPGFETYLGNSTAIVTGSQGADTIAASSLRTSAQSQGAATIYGGDGADNISGSHGDDRIYGGRGDDFLTDFRGSNLLDGGDGNDTIFSSNSDVDWTNHSTVLGGAGDDSIAVYIPSPDNFGINTSVYAGAGSDTIYANEKGAYLDGGDGIDFFILDTFDSYPYTEIFLNRQQGDAYITGVEVVQYSRNGSVLIVGSGFAETLSGGESADTIGLSGGADSLNADGTDEQSSGDWLTLEYLENGGASAYLADGIAIYQSEVSSLENFENLRGSRFDDILVGDTGANRIEGSNGNDYLDGNAGSDTLAGGMGEDTFAVGAGDVIEDFGAYDFIELASGPIIGITTAISGNNTVLTINGTETVTLLNASYSAEELEVLPDSITVRPTQTNDDLPIASITEQIIGDDTATLTITTTSTTPGIEIRDIEASVSGSEDIPLDPEGSVMMDLPVSTAFKSYSPANMIDQAEAITMVNLLPWLEGLNEDQTGMVHDALEFYGADSAFHILVLSTSPTHYFGTTLVVNSRVSSQIYVYDGRNTDVSFQAEGATDVVMLGETIFQGGAVAGRVWGDADAQSLILGAGADTAQAGDGNDLVYGNLDNDVIYGNQANDQVFGGQGDDRLYGGQDSDVLFGNRDNDVIYGNFGNDVIFGNSGADTLFGGQAQDTLFGGQGDDRLLGNLGDDELVGNLGNDMLTGGAGADRFSFSGPSGQDIVTDYNAAEGDAVTGGLYSRQSAFAIIDEGLLLSAGDGSSLLLVGIASLEQVVFA